LHQRDTQTSDFRLRKTPAVRLATEVVDRLVTAPFDQRVAGGPPGDERPGIRHTPVSAGSRLGHLDSHMEDFGVGIIVCLRIIAHVAATAYVTAFAVARHPGNLFIAESDDLEGAAVVFRPAIHADEDFQPFATGTDEEGERGRHRPEEGDQHRKIFHMVEIQSDDHRIGRHLVVTMPAPENP